MTNIRHVFFDIGGVLATNGWDREQRKVALTRFGIDEAEFQARHEEMVGPLEQGQISLDEYLDITVHADVISPAIASINAALIAAPPASPKKSMAIVTSPLVSPARRSSRGGPAPRPTDLSPTYPGVRLQRST